MRNRLCIEMGINHNRLNTVIISRSTCFALQTEAIRDKSLDRLLIHRVQLCVHADGRTAPVREKERVMRFAFDGARSGFQLLVCDSSCFCCCSRDWGKCSRQMQTEK